jgi:hypothetical protein
VANFGVGGSKTARRNPKVVATVNRAEFFALPVGSFDQPFLSLAYLSGQV